jgi:hypothetical protein
MKITKNQLKQIIKEELSSVLATEGLFDFFGGGKKDEPAKEEIPDAELMNQLTEEDNTAAELIHALHLDGILDAEEVFGITIQAYAAGSGGSASTQPTAIVMARARLSEDPAKQALFKNLLQLASRTKRIEPKSGREEKYASKENVWVTCPHCERKPAEGISPAATRDFKFDSADNIAPTIVDAMARRHKEYKDNWNTAYDKRDRSQGELAGQEDARDRAIERGEVDWHTGKFTEKGKAEYQKRRRERGF